MKHFLLILLCASSHLTAQESITEVKKQAFGNPLDPVNQDAITLLNRIDSEEEYSLMLFDHWQPMDVEGKDGIQLHIDSANYHIGQDKFFFINQKKLYELFPEKIHDITMNQRTFVNTPYEFEEYKVKPRYFEMLEAGEYTLLRKFEIKKEVTNDHPMGIAAATEVKYRHDEKFYYLRKGARLPEVVPTNKKDFIMIFKKNRPELVIFAKENKISLRSGEELKVIFAYYNRLAEQS